MFSKVNESTFDAKNSSLLPDFITCNERFFTVIELIKLVAAVNSTVLIYGETGTGKSLAAHQIHLLSNRSEKPFVKINCGAIAYNLIESELFGYEPGTFTGARKEGKRGLIESANEGTFFLDEISELPLDQQVKLLQVLQDKKITRVGGTKPIELDVRFIAATNKDLEKMVIDKQFREDLFYRLNVVPIKIPPLRDRSEDIPLLIKHFLKKYPSKNFTSNALQCLCDYEWPGNVRELEYIVERLVVTTKKPLIGINDLPEKIVQFKTQHKIGTSITIQEILPLQAAIEETEKKLIEMALEKYKTASKVAEILKVNQSTISRKMQTYGLGNKLGRE